MQVLEFKFKTCSFVAAWCEGGSQTGSCSVMHSHECVEGVGQEALGNEELQCCLGLGTEQGCLIP